MSIRLRLTLLYSAILAVTLIAFGVGLYVAVYQITLHLAQDALTTEAHSFAAALRPHPDRDGHLSIILPINVVAPRTSIQVWRFDGSIAYQSSDLQAAHSTLPLSASTRKDMQQGNTIPPADVTVDGTQVLLYTMPLVVQSDGPIPIGASSAPIGILQVARPLQEINQPLNPLRQVLLLGGGIVTLLAFGAGWVLAGTALRPINRITQTAQEIGATQDFDRRVDYEGPHDEVGRLAGTFNTMLTGLQAAYHVQRRFVADASHELRTPLTTIRGNLGLLQREPPITEADRVAVLADLVSESERLSRLVGDLLTLARSDAGRPLRQEPVPVGPLLADLIRRLTVLYPEHVIHVHHVHNEGRPDVIALGDPDALTQVLLILLDNALKFTPTDGAVTVTTTTDDSHVSIAVGDMGPGIAPDVLPHIFERFYQGNVARTGTGTGLGLAIASALVDGQHGALTARSSVGQGSLFTVTLPYSPPTA